MRRILVGCCGWAVKGGREAYFQKFPAIEIQETFYKLPRTETVMRWREKAPSGFVFCMKAWQAVSHPVSSPTWRRAGLKPGKSEATRYGWLRPVKENFAAWEKTAEVAKAMQARVVVIQTPASMPDDQKTQQNVMKFFEHVSTHNLTIAWEPRGRLAKNKIFLQKVCEKHGIIHVTDILKSEPATQHRIFYTRLHGLGGGEVNYRYRYTDEDLHILAEKIYAKDFDEGYVFFNNLWMAEDAERFMRMLKRENKFS
ncbi:MAG: DUF72 domain-containing protein [Candidatus Caldarchaeum sp.]|uniref:DUF72 domain-containing protein n=1 Tax=Caldiarchaeum subterraneum TaxID=311458 RepID=A0A7C4E211_CALS0